MLPILELEDLLDGSEFPNSGLHSETGAEEDLRLIANRPTGDRSLPEGMKNNSGATKEPPSKIGFEKQRESQLNVCCLASSLLAWLVWEPSLLRITGSKLGEIRLAPFCSGVPIFFVAKTLLSPFAFLKLFSWKKFSLLTSAGTTIPPA